MNPEATAARPGQALRLAGACATLLALAVAAGIAVNLLRPASSRLPWVGDWSRHIETKAFRADIPVAFLAGVRDRLNDPAVAALDARVPAEYAAGHLPGALNLPVGEADQRIGEWADRLTPQTPILVYCSGADCTDALDLALKLREYGFEDLTLYPGGYAEWTEYGGAVRTGTQP